MSETCHPLMNNVSRLWCRRINRFLYKLYAACLIYIDARGRIGCWLLRRIYTIGTFLLCARCFSDLRQADMNLTGDGLSLGCSGLAMRIVILMYKAEGLSGGC